MDLDQLYFPASYLGGNKERIAAITKHADMIRLDSSEAAWVSDSLSVTQESMQVPAGGVNSVTINGKVHHGTGIMYRTREASGFGHTHTVDSLQMAEILYPGCSVHYDVIAAIAEPSSPAFWDMLREQMSGTLDGCGLPDLEIAS